MSDSLGVGLRISCITLITTYSSLDAFAVLAGPSLSGYSAMFRILVAPVLLAIVLFGCSRTDDGPKFKDSAASMNPVPDAVSHSEVTPPDRDIGAKGEVKDAAGATRHAARKTSQKMKQASAEATDAPSSTAKDWRNFEIIVKKCDAMGAAENEQCQTDARNTYGAWHLNCETMSPEDKAQCRRYLAQWKSARTDTPHAHTPAVRSGEPNTIPADAGDPSDKERNRDSTKQQAATVQPPKEN